jgi:hypothetical protein
MSRFVLSGPNPGLLVRGTIDIIARTNVMVVNKDGSISSVRSMSFGLIESDRTKIAIPRSVWLAHEQVEVLCPTVVPHNGKWVIIGGGGAESRAKSMGLHLGVFDNVKHANAYANRLHLQQAKAGQQLKAALRKRKRGVR